MFPISGNALGLAMFVAAGLIAGAGLALGLNQTIIMFAVGLGLIVMDGMVRLRQRPAERWWWRQDKGGYLYIVPAWVGGIIIILVNIINIFAPLEG